MILRPFLFATVLLCALPAQGFHDGGVGSCDACHQMHEAADGSLLVADGGLLREGSPSDLCLACHAGSYGAVLGTDPLAPPPERGAGNFVFLYEDDLDDGPDAGAPPLPGHHAGHSIVAPAYGLFPDPSRNVAPGGYFPSDRLGCTSCHDPHGNDNFRMLNGAGPVQDGLFEFVEAAPLAAGIPLDEAEGPGLHSAYRAGVSAWCANCHGEYHDRTGAVVFQHEFDLSMESGERARYDAYDGEGNPDGGWSATAYLPVVPFEDPAAAIDSTWGPTPASRVMCLTCHRAHATSSPRAARWDMRVWRLGDDGLASGSLASPNPYGDPGQPQLCVKCHERDHAESVQMSCLECHRRERGDRDPWISD